MYPVYSTAFPLSRTSSSSSDSAGLDAYAYTRSDESCSLNFQVGDLVWARTSGTWALGIVISPEYPRQACPGAPFLPTYDVLLAAHPRKSDFFISDSNFSKDQNQTSYRPASFSPLLGVLKPADARMRALLTAEGWLPPHASSADAETGIIARALTKAAREQRRSDASVIAGDAEGKKAARWLITS
ncbi:hypothetical protein M0805_001762 [Coniferiporia weirii]|nr:hypothetical protein M0805_001762 [Coniferiporia weirii]